jgi:hypothetical protein
MVEIKILTLEGMGKETKADMCLLGLRVRISSRGVEISLLCMLCCAI